MHVCQVCFVPSIVIVTTTLAEEATIVCKCVYAAAVDAIVGLMLCKRERDMCDDALCTGPCCSKGWIAHETSPSFV